MHFELNFKFKGGKECKFVRVNFDQGRENGLNMYEWDTSYLLIMRIPKQGKTSHGHER